jgi:hypothetical protein
MKNINININFQWFVGFSEAECNFYTSKNKDSQKFQIHLHIRDIELLYKIKDIIGYGNIYIDNKRNRVQYVVSDKDTLYNIIIPIFEEYPLLTLRKRLQYLSFKDILNKRYIKSSKIVIIESNNNNYNNNISKSYDIINKSYYSN